MNIKIGTTHTLFFAISASSGAAANADSLPTCDIYEDNATTAIYSPTVVNVNTGLYMVAIECSGANGFEAGKTYNVVISATVGGVSAKSVIGRFVCTTNNVDDVATSATLIFNDTHTTGVKLASGELNSVLTVLNSTGVKIVSADLNAVLDAISASDTTLNQVLSNTNSLGVSIGDLADVVAGIYQDTHTDGVKISDGNLVEGSLNIRQVLAEMFAMLLGVIVKNGDTYTVKNPAGDTTRATIETDGNGNRTSVTLNPPA